MTCWWDRHRAWIVALRLALHRHPREVGDPDGDAQRRLPVPVQFVTPEIEIPPGHAVQFADHALPAVLMHGGLGLLCGRELVPGAEHVDPRKLKGAVGPHRLAERGGLTSQGRLLHHVPRQHQPVFLAPRADLIGKRRGEPFGDVVVVEVTDSGNFAVRQFPDQLGQPVEERLAVGGAKRLFQIVREGKRHVAVALCKGKNGFSRELRFVGEDRRYGFPECRRKTPAITLVGRLDEARDRLRIERVQIGLIVEPGVLARRFEIEP